MCTLLRNQTSEEQDIIPLPESVSVIYDVGCNPFVTIHTVGNVDGFASVCLLEIFTHILGKHYDLIGMLNSLLLSVHDST